MEYYMQKTYYKTASLISNSCKAIALLAGQTAEVAMLAYEYGKILAHQLPLERLPYPTSA
ncbi:solanesyl diphosphate synthase 3, chloroplastic/mitochondrial-like isoform X4, partial [Fagus crenata]